MRWSDEQEFTLRQLMKAGHSYQSAAYVLGRPRGSVREKCRAMGIASLAKSGRQPPLPDVPIYDGALELAGDFVIAADVHAPCTDWLMASRVGLIGQKYLDEPRRLLLAGDLLNFEAFSKYEALVPQYNLKDEIQAAQFAVSLWLEAFDHIYLTLGNHDYRWLKAMKGVYPEDTIVELFEALLGNHRQLTISLYPYVTISTAQGLWRVTHPAEYAQNPLTKARKMANIYKGQHIIMAHQHHDAIALDESGKHVLVDLPALVDPEKLAYVQLADSTKPRMKRGFVLLKGGTVTRFSDRPELTDWGQWLDEPA